jgi:dTDP-4-amino-4,6-dideoxygalactose transaminase
VSSTIAMADPAAEYRALAAELDEAVHRVLASGRYILGPEGEAFEREFAARVGAQHAVGMNSGTDALHLALVAAGIGEGDEVIVPGFTFFASAEAVSHARATPVFADVDARTFNLVPEALRGRITGRTRAVIAVHLFGQCAPMDAIAAICAERGLVLIEDCAQAIGADWDGRVAGSLGSFGCFSFYPTKNLAAAGDGGLVTCREPAHADALRTLRHHGSRRPYVHDRIGWNSRLDELQAAMLRVKLGQLERFNAERARVARAYRERLGDVPVELPFEHGRGRHVWHQFTIRSERRDALRAALTEANVATAVFYALPLYRQPAYVNACGDVTLPVCERLAGTVLSLPIHPFLGEAAIDRITSVIRAHA